MKKASVIGYGAGDVVRLGPATIRILEDGRTTAMPSPEAGAEVMSRYATEIADTYAGEGAMS